MLIAPLRSAETLDGFERAARIRQTNRAGRAAQAMLVAALAWIATHDMLVIAWLMATLSGSVLEAAAMRRLGRPDGRGPVAAAQALNAIVFVSIAAVLLLSPEPARLAEAMLFLCAVTLGNAMQSTPSHLTRLCLMAPPAVFLALSPLWAHMAGFGLGAGDTVLLTAAAVVFSLFTLRLSVSMSGEHNALRQAIREADLGNERWQMVFENSPMARMAFNAAPLYERLMARSAGNPRLGDVARAEFSDIRAMLAHVTVLEANRTAAALCGENVTRLHFAPGFFDAFCDALNEIDDEGSIPPFNAGIILQGGGVMMAQVHYRMMSGLGAPWSLCLATYVDMTDTHRLARIQDEARVAAEAANRAKSDFLAVMSHEIRTPLNGVLGMAQAMAREPLDPAQRERLEVIRGSGSALMTLLDDLLDLSRIEAGRLTLDEREFDLRAVVGGTIAAFTAEAATKGLDLRLEMEPAVEGQWRGDPVRVGQILSNLISNAVKFTHEGHVAVQVSRSVSGMRIEVSDTGIGIAPDRVTRLFEKFAQADVSATREYGGVGLGLAICQELCRAMGGAVTVGSAPGHGSTFAVELPLRHIEPAAPAHAVEAEVLSAAEIRVLAAEDNSVNQMVLKALLAQFGVEPTIVENGAEAVRAWESAHWDLILMDVQMPVMDGPTATMTIRAREALLGRARTPILAVTANTMAHQVASYRAAGMDDVVAKPLAAAELFTAIAGALSAPEDDDEALRAAS